MQLNFNLEPAKPTGNPWAFAVDKRFMPLRARARSASIRAGRSPSRCVITACSKEARRYGVRAGMRLPEAKTRLPQLKVLIYNR